MKKFLAITCALSFAVAVFAQSGNVSDIDAQNYVTTDSDSARDYDPENPVLTGSEGAKLFTPIDPLEGIKFPLVVYFGPDAVDFSKPDILDEELAAGNAAIFDQVVAILTENPEYRLVIEGHANVVLQTKAEVKELETMSLQRAQTVAQLLMERGIERKNLVVAFAGGELPVAPFADHDSWYKNRRVEISFTKSTVESPVPAAEPATTDAGAVQPLL